MLLFLISLFENKILHQISSLIMPLNSTLKHVSLDFSNIALKSSIESNTTTKKYITQNSGRTIALTLQDLMHSSILQHTNITFIL